MHKGEAATHHLFCRQREKVQIVVAGMKYGNCTRDNPMKSSLNLASQPRTCLSLDEAMRTLRHHDHRAVEGRVCRNRTVENTCHIPNGVIPDRCEALGVGPNAVLFGQNLIAENPGALINVGDEIEVIEIRDLQN